MVVSFAGRCVSSCGTRAWTGRRASCTIWMRSPQHRRVMCRCSSAPPSRCGVLLSVAFRCRSIWMRRQWHHMAPSSGVAVIRKVYR